MNNAFDLVDEPEQSSTVLPDTPNAWFVAKFPCLKAIYGDPVQEVTPEARKDEEPDPPFVKALCQDFIAATLSQTGSPEEPTVYVAAERRFYRYNRKEGIYEEISEAKLAEIISNLLLDCAQACTAKFNTNTLEFGFRDRQRLSWIVKCAQGILEVKHTFFQTDLSLFIACQNGMLRLSDRQLLPFSPDFRRRNKLSVPYIPTSTCPTFLETLMRQAVDEDDLTLLQTWGGQALLGDNLSQSLLIITGTAGGGKGTFIRVLTGIIGEQNIGTLRTELLGERFEIGRLSRATLLYGADVQADFLNCSGASLLKSLTGGDLVTLEFKGSNDKLQAPGRFNAVVTSNSRLSVHLEGDAPAWRRRLAIVEYEREKSPVVIAKLSEIILSTEAPGVLLWLLDGLDRLRSQDWQLVLTTKQAKLVDDLLLESESDTVFAKECLLKDSTGTLTIQTAYEKYVEFSSERSWKALSRNAFSSRIQDTIQRLYSVGVRNDIKQDDGRAQRGWKGIKFVSDSVFRSDLWAD